MGRVTVRWCIIAGMKRLRVRTTLSIFIFEFHIESLLDRSIAHSRHRSELFTSGKSQVDQKPAEKWSGKRFEIVKFAFLSLTLFDSH